MTLRLRHIGHRSGQAHLLIALVLSVVTVDAQRPARGLATAGGDHLLYIGTYAGSIQIFDEATEQKVGDISSRPLPSATAPGRRASVACRSTRSSGS